MLTSGTKGQTTDRKLTYTTPLTLDECLHIRLANIVHHYGAKVEHVMISVKQPTKYSLKHSICITITQRT